MHLRVGVKAIIINHDQLVTIKKRDEYGDFYSFPGGGQHPGETLVQAVEREVHEETGWNVDVGKLLFVREYIGKNHEYAETDSHIHVVDHLFLCSLRNPLIAPQPSAPDPDQVEVVWLSMKRLADYRFFPRTLIPHLIEITRGKQLAAPVYVGDVN